MIACLKLQLSPAGRYRVVFVTIYEGNFQVKAKLFDFYMQCFQPKAA